MNDKINIGEVTIAEFNIIMKQLTAGQLGECLDLFMRFSDIAKKHQESQSDVRQPPYAAK
jgi:hypothetical protein